MSLDKDTVVTHEGPLRLSPSFTAGSLPLPQQPQLTKVQPLYPKFGLQQPNNGQPPPSSSPPPLQRIGKRRYTVGVGFKGLAKRRRRTHSESQADPVLPSHFLLGGNIFDPLNLNSLLNEEVSRWDGGHQRPIDWLSLIDLPLLIWVSWFVLECYMWRSQTWQYLSGLWNNMTNCWGSVVKLDKTFLNRCWNRMKQ